MTRPIRSAALVAAAGRAGALLAPALRPRFVARRARTAVPLLFAIFLRRGLPGILRVAVWVG